MTAAPEMSSLPLREGSGDRNYSTFLANPASDPYRLTATGISRNAGPVSYLFTEIHFGSSFCISEETGYLNAMALLPISLGRAYGR